MQAAQARRDLGLPARPRRLKARDGKTYRAYEPGHWLSETDKGLVYLHTRFVDIILNGVEFVRYDHDGAGGLTLTGNFGVSRKTLKFARSRFEPIEAQRAFYENYPREQDRLDKTMASLLAAIDQAEAWWHANGGEP